MKKDQESLSFGPNVFRFDNCDRVCIKGPFVRNLKNEIIKFYDKLGFKASFPLISERNLLFFPIFKSIFPAEYRNVKITNIGDMAA